jgi:hypothetical protein
LPAPASIRADPVATSPNEAVPEAVTEAPSEERAWDVFISHASEDKIDVAEPLAILLQEAGAAVWYDRFELKIGSSLREKIDEGLALSKYGIVILSPNFFAKQWPKAELAGLVSNATWSCLLPVWHRVTQEDVRRFSPILADRVGGNTDAGLPQIARQIIRILDESGPGTPAVDQPTRTIRLRRLLEASPNSEAVQRFLILNDDIVLGAFGSTHSGVLVDRCELGDISVNFAIGRRNQTAGRFDWNLLFLGPVHLEFVQEERLGYRPNLDTEIAAAQNARSWVRNNLPIASKRLRDLQSGVGATILAGRRERMTPEQRLSLTALGEMLPGITIRTYDWLLEGVVAWRQSGWHGALRSQCIM